MSDFIWKIIKIIQLKFCIFSWPGNEFQVYHELLDMSIHYLVIEGNIGAGKTTLAQMISKKYGTRLVLEQFADNPFLPKFYENPTQYAFPLEMAFLAARYNQLSHELTESKLTGSMTISDYFFTKSLIFAKNTLHPDEFNLYNQFFSIIYDKMPKPDLYVYLHKDTNLLLRNIALRGRSYESHITGEYLNKITEGYFNYFSQQTDIAILNIDTNNLDFENRPSDFEKINQLIFNNQYNKGITQIQLQ